MATGSGWRWARPEAAPGQHRAKSNQRGGSRAAGDRRRRHSLSARARPFLCRARAGNGVQWQNRFDSRYRTWCCWFWHRLCQGERARAGVETKKARASAGLLPPRRAAHVRAQRRPLLLPPSSSLSCSFFTEDGLPGKCRDSFSFRGREKGVRTSHFFFSAAGAPAPAATAAALVDADPVPTSAPQSAFTVRVSPGPPKLTFMMPR